jgi:uncharacterized membrane protein
MNRLQTATDAGAGNDDRGTAPDRAAPAGPFSRWPSWAPGGALIPPLLLALALGAIVGFAAPAQFALPTRLILAWDAFLVVVLIAQWWIILRSTWERCHARAQADDPGNVFILITSIIGSGAALAAALVVLDRPDPALDAFGDWIFEAMVLIAVVGGWVLLQTSYTLHYARIYYANPDAPGGLDFPDPPPDDYDSAYFAFTTGMTFQVSDVGVTTKAMRQVVLKQSILSFFYNLAIFALVINIVAAST